MTSIVTYAHRYKRPPRKRKAAALEVPAVVRVGKRAEVPAQSREPAIITTSGKPANDDRKPAIVTTRQPGRRYADVPDMTPEEVQRRGDAADALWRELVRRATAKDRP